MIRILASIPFFASVILGNFALAGELVLPGGDFSTLRNTGTAKVTEIISPLTIKLENGKIIHLAGLDYPDLDPYNPGDLSVTAMHILDDFLKGNTVVVYQTPSSEEGRVNRMGHAIAHLVRTDKDVWVQGMMLSLGLARVRTTKYTPQMAKQMLALENNARASKEGLWGMEHYTVLSPGQAENHIGSYQIVEGNVQNVSRHKNTLFLNFGNNWRDDFTVSITSSNLRDFTNAKLEPQQWNGKNIRVRGWIESWNGAHIKIDHPERIELIFEKQETEKQITAPTNPPKKTSPGSALPSLNP